MVSWRFARPVTSEMLALRGFQGGSETLISRLFRDCVQFCSGLVDLAVYVGHYGGSAHRLTLAGERFVGLVAEDIAQVGDHRCRGFDPSVGSAWTPQSNQWPRSWSPAAIRSPAARRRGRTQRTNRTQTHRRLVLHPGGLRHHRRHPQPRHRKDTRVLIVRQFPCCRVPRRARRR
jgi:hypothetical protein